MHGDDGLTTKHKGLAMQEKEYGEEAADQMTERGFTYYKDPGPDTTVVTEAKINTTTGD
jgi:hypothetical protein